MREGWVFRKSLETQRPHRATVWATQDRSPNEAAMVVKREGQRVKKHVGSNPGKALTEKG